MAPTDATLIETLLNMSESDVLDFKRDQYPLVGATDDEKGELIKDVLAFANAWKTSDAHIVIGADENPGGRAVVVGVSGHPNDADLQQLVNSKTNAPVAFEYLAVTVDGLPIGVIRIKGLQQRPIFLRRSFGKLRPNTAYVRRGTSTAEADPTEIARMGASSAVLAVPQVALDVADPKERRVLGTAVQITSKLLAKRPPRIPDRALGSHRTLMKQLHAPAVADFYSRWDRPNPQKVLAYEKELGLLVRLGFRLKNTGKVLVEDARVFAEVPKQNDLRVVDELPQRPRGRLEMHPRFRPFVEPVRTTVTTGCGDRWEVIARLGKIQPDETVWSAPFWVGSPVPRDLSVLARVFGDNIATPIDVPLTVSIQVENGWLEEERSEGDDEERTESEEDDEEMEDDTDEGAERSVAGNLSDALALDRAGAETHQLA
jgi:hypothetical protein